MDTETGRPGTGRNAASGARGLWLLLALWAGSLVGAAVLAPPAYWAAQRWAEASATELAAWLAGKGLPVFFDRIRWLLVLAGVPWLCRATGLTGARALGLTLRREDGSPVWPAALAWLGVGLATVAAVAVGQLAAGVARGRALAPTAEVAGFLGFLAMALLGAAAIAVFEELVFRGIVFQLFRRALAVAPAVLAAALVFALVHFQSVPAGAWPAGAPAGPAGAAGLGAGFAVAWASLAALPGTLDPPVAVALFLAGTILCLVFLRAGSLLAPMGLHAGWVLGARFHRLLLEVDPDAPAGATALWGSRTLIDGAAPLALLAALALVLALAPARGRRQSRSLGSERGSS